VSRSRSPEPPDTTARFVTEPAADAARFVTEPAKDAGFDAGLAESRRSPFSRDRARVLHSSAFRRLAAKTQVHGTLQPVGSVQTAGDGFLRTRLTHSMEVAQIAREMGAQLGCDPDVVDTAGLAHDLGHPPFGHNGEDALNRAAASCGGFEGNAQTLRVVSRLEAKILRPDGTSAGLNLTRASLDAACKYPWARQPGQRKFGVYADDLEIFTWLRAGAPADQPTRVCLEAQVMDWADDVAYSVHDVEDGFHLGLITLRPLLADPDERAALCKDAAEVYSDETPDALAPVLDELLAEPVLAEVASFDGGQRSLIALKRAASVLIGRFVAEAVDATQERHGTGPLRRYDADLVVPRAARARCALLKGVALRYVMRRPGSEQRYAREQEILRDLVAVLVQRAPVALDPIFAPLWREASDDYSRLRIVIDQVASLTDTAARRWHERLH
jgi:dGTPase